MGDLVMEKFLETATKNLNEHLDYGNSTINQLGIVIRVLSLGSVTPWLKFHSAMKLKGYLRPVITSQIDLPHGITVRLK